VKLDPPYFGMQLCEQESFVLHALGQSPRIAMLDHESVAKPLGIGLNMLVDPFLCSWRQWAKQKHGPFIAHQYVGRGLEFNFHVIFVCRLLTCRICLVGGHRGTLSSSVGGDAAWAPRS